MPESPNKLMGFEEWFGKTFKKDFTFRDGAYSWVKAGWEAAVQNQHKQSLPIETGWDHTEDFSKHLAEGLADKTYTKTSVVRKCESWCDLYSNHEGECASPFPHD